MSVENVKSFYKRLEEDEEFRAEIAKDETLKDLDIGKLVTVASKDGYEFTETDFEKAKEEYGDTELSEAELEKVAGGLGYGVCVFVGIGLFGMGASVDEVVTNTHKRETAGDSVAIGFCLGPGLN
jgi:predicted ribosomally synthesized peptide with nif11-like leader